MKGRLLAGIAALVVAATLVGCTAATPAGQTAAPVDATPLSELQVLSDPKAYQGPSTAVISNAAVEVVDADRTQSLPAQVVSHDQGGDRPVTVADTSRVVALSLSGSLAATVWGLGFGDTLVGRDISTTFPGAVDLPVVTGSGHTINAEAVIALRPTLVLTDGSIGPRDVVEQLRDVGITVVAVRNESSFEGAEQLARDVAAVFGAPAAGEALAAQTAAQVAATTAEIARIAPTAEDRKLRMIFLYLRGSAGVYYLFGEESGADRLITALGGVDVAGQLGWGGMKPMTDEAMVAADPDLILVMTDGLASVGGVDGLLQDKPAIALTTAGQNRRFVDMADGQILSFGPRSAAVLDALARAIYAPAAAGS
ncbi:hemin ABC transporter substrate-binding protein [Microbacterium sp. SORGH_AS_0888]|uniref:heme/hemin ABC transporter substrate-binding protein n=1 Tax=Microbacterium sp. SORGH_AS_0888 TaxID=3041791 RepID=UPI0027831E1D|nr:ABC transporter substrate-binding protein [Microbacterium sp. SORGH_AS_0888]MDQ1130128.1 iron complex transport system substrate-binding protein [Microbacterium sp. SORGH_AS_0888]